MTQATLTRTSRFRVPPDVPEPRVVPKTRDILLGAAVAVLAGALLLELGADILRFITDLEADALVDIKVAGGFMVVSTFVGAMAFVVAAMAFFLARKRRATRLGVAAIMLIGSFLAGVVALSLVASAIATNDAPARLVATYSAQAAGRLVLASAALLTTIAFLSRATSKARLVARRDGLLGWASLGLAIAYGLFMAAQILLLTVIADFVTGGLKAGLGVTIAGYGVVIAAASVAVVAFLVSRHQQLRAQRQWLSRRDGLLGASAAVFAIGFLAEAIGRVLIAAADPDNFTKGKLLAADWLSAGSSFAFVAAAVCASVGFLMSRRSRT